MPGKQAANHSGGRSAMITQPFAQIVFRNAVVYTADGQRSRASSLAVVRDRIAYVGGEAGIGAWIGPATEVCDLGGKPILPGFRDSHIHPLTGSFNLLECRLSGPAGQAA